MVWSTWSTKLVHGFVAISWDLGHWIAIGRSGLNLNELV
jgi:hypothetical protein